ncbi:MAG: hypothetical protein QNK05_12900 [Myxococcota bacterium]|nr:hypothetical protein [Myxococcota bacterium]
MSPERGRIDGAAAEVRDQLIPLLKALDGLLAAEGAEDPRAFFAAIARKLSLAREPEDLMQPFLELGTTAFRGFEFPIAAGPLIDEVLRRAQEAAQTLSAEGTPH